MAGYHINEIKKGELYKFSKVIEEFEEFQDAVMQNNKIMEMVELSDLLGALNLYVEKEIKSFDINQLLNDINNKKTNDSLDVLFKNLLKEKSIKNIENFLIGLNTYMLNFNLTINDLKTMSDLTRKVFEEGYR